MKDQLDSLLAKNLKAGAVSSGFTKKEIDITLQDWLNGDLDFLFIAPERLSNEQFLQVIKQQPPTMVVVDEIHVASEHSDNFRPNYCKIAPFIEDLSPRIFLGLTATFPEAVEEDIRRIFQLDSSVKTETALYRRKNLHYSSKPLMSIHDDIIKTVNNIDGPCIIYCSTVRMVDEIYDSYKDLVTGGLAKYHGSLSASARESAQNMFINDRVRVVVATNSFGMGIDKPDIKGVLYRSYPGSIEEMAQGFGRGGRNECDCECILFRDPDTVSVQEFFIDSGHPSKNDIVRFYNAIKSSTNKDGLCFLRLGDLATRAGVDGIYLQAIMNNLLGAGVVARVDETLPVSIRILNNAVTINETKVLDVIKKFGVMNSSHYYEFDIDFISEQLSVTENTLKRNLKELEKANKISLFGLTTSKPLQIVGPIDNVDFARLEAKKREASKKFREVLQYAKDIPDHMKGDYLFKYFKSKNKK